MLFWVLRITVALRRFICIDNTQQMVWLRNKKNISLITHSYVEPRTGTECESRIEKSVPRIAVWHHEACRVMTNGDPEGLIFLSYPHTNTRFFFLHTTDILFKNKLPRSP